MEEVGGYIIGLRPTALAMKKIYPSKIGEAERTSLKYLRSYTEADCEMKMCVESLKLKSLSRKGMREVICVGLAQQEECEISGWLAYCIKVR